MHACIVTADPYAILTLCLAVLLAMQMVSARIRGVWPPTSSDPCIALPHPLFPRQAYRATYTALDARLAAARVLLQWTFAKVVIKTIGQRWEVEEYNRLTIVSRLIPLPKPEPYLLAAALPPRILIF